MQVDISTQISRRKALDRWENEGGRVSADGMELFSSNSSCSVRAEAGPRADPELEQQS